MNDKTVTLRLAADGKAVAPGVRVAQTELDKLGGTGKKAGTAARDSFKGANAEIERTGRSASVAESMVRRFLGAAAVSAALVNVGRTADAYSDIVGKLKQVSSGEKELAAAKASTFNIAQKYYQQLDATVTLYGRSTRALQEYGYTQAQAAKLTETVSAGLLVDRAGTAESASAMLQLSQALGAGALRGEEFNAMAEAAPSLMKVLADSLGMPRGALKKMAEEGQLTIDVLVDAFTGANADRLAEQASQAPLTISRAWQQAKNEALRTVGEFDQASAISAGVAQGISLVSKNLETLAKIAAFAATMFAVNLIQRGILAGVAAFNTLSVSMAPALVGMNGMGVGAARLTIAQTAAAVATRGLSGAMTLLSANPIMVVVAAIGLVVADLWSAREAARQATAEIRAGIESAQTALEAFNRTPSLEAAFDLKPKQINAAIQGAISQLRELQQERDKLVADENNLFFGDPERLIEVNRQINLQTTELRGLQTGWQAATDYLSDATAKMLGVGDGSIYAREEIRRIHQQLLDGAITEEQAEERWRQIAATHGDAAAAARVNALSVRELSAAVSAAKGDFDDYDKKLQQLTVRLAAVRGGAAAALEMEVGQDINRAAREAGKGDRAKGMEALRASGELEKYGQYLQALRGQTLEVETAEKAKTAATKAGTTASREASKVTKDHTRDLEQQAESQRRYILEAERAQAQLQGPMKVAEVEHAQRIAEIDQALKEHNITQAAANSLKGAYEAQLKKTTDELAKQQAAPTALLDTMTGELQLLGMIGPERERYSRQLQNERDMRQAITESIAAGNAELKDSPDMQAQYIAQARAMADYSIIAEESAAQAEDWSNAWYRGIGSVADAFTDFVMSGLKDFKSFGSSLKNIAKQTIADLIRTYMQSKLVVPIQAEVTGMSSSGSQGNMLQSLMSLFSGNGFGGAGQTGGAMGGIGQLFGGQGGWGSKVASFFGFGGNSTASGSGWGGFAPNVAGFNGWGGAAMASGAAGSGGGLGLGSMTSAASMFGKNSMGSFLTSPAAPWVAGAAGALYGWQKGGDTPGKAAGAVAYGVAGAGVMAGVGAGMGAAAAGAGLAGAGMAGLAAIPVVGWIALAAIAIDKISGGKLFGTKFKTDSTAVQLDFNNAGASGATTVNQSGQKSFFRGKKYRTNTTALDDEAQAAVDEMFDSISSSVNEAASRLGIATPDFIAGSFRQEFDAKGNLKKEFSTIAGKVYNEAQEEFTKRLLAENLLNVAKSVGSSAEIESLATGYRSDPAALSDFAVLTLAMQSDIKSLVNLWETGAGSFTRVVETIEDLVQGSETLAETYARVTTAANNYGSFIADIETQLRTSDLTQYQRAQLDIEMGYRDQVKQANALAKALGLSGARSEDLARIEQLRALNMASLQTQIESDRNNILSGLKLSEYSPLTDAQKLQEAMTQLQKAVASGDTNAAASLSQTALGFGRNLYASGNDYNSLYNQVTGLIESIALPSMDMEDGTSMDELADILQALPRDFATELFALLMNPAVVTPGTGLTTPPSTGTPAPTPATGTGNGGTGMTETNVLLGQILALQQRNNAAAELALLRQGVAVP